MTFGFGSQAGNRVTVEIVGDADKLRRETSAAERETRGFARNAANDLKLLKGAAVGVATGIGAIGATVAGIAVKGGVDRLMGLERANRQLSQLGVSTGDAKRLTDSLLDSLLGTPFALDKGAASLAGFVASGRDLKDIPRLIQQVTDAAAFGNVTLEEADFIWQRIQTTGRVTNKELRMLAERNIPVYTQLAGAFETTAGEVFDMARSGELSADMFFDAWEKAADGSIEGTVKIAGAAKAMGETTDGAWANMRTAMSRFGATLLEDVFPLAKNLFTAIGEGFDRMGRVVSQAFDNVDTSGLEEFIDRIPGMMESGAQAMIDFWEATEVVRDNVGTAISGLVAIIESEMGKAVIAVGALKLALDGLKRHPLIAFLAALGFVAGKIKEHVDDIQEPINEIKDRFDELEDAAKAETFRRAIEEAWGPEAVATIERFLAKSGTSIDELARTTDGAAGIIEMSGQDIGATWDEVERQIDEQTRRSIEHIEKMGPAWEGSGSSAGEFEVKVAEAADGVSSSVDGIEGDLEEMAEKAEEEFDKALGEVDDFIDGFKEIPEETDTSLQEWIDNMNARNAQIQAWFDNLNFLRERGMHEFVSEMEKAGPEAASGLVQEAVDAINDGNTGLPWLANQAAAGAEDVGERLAEGAARGVNNRAADLAASAEAMVRAALARARKAAQVESPSKLFEKELGEPIAEGAAKGVDDSAAPERAMAEMVDDMAGGATTTGGGTGSPGFNGGRGVHITLENRGIIGSEQELLDWLAGALNELELIGRL